MKDFYAKHNTKYSWLIKEEGWVRSIQGVRESQLALGNGFLGTRAVLEEIPYDARPGTYITGLYDNIGSRVDELVNLPNPFNFRITVDGEKLGVITMDALEHRRTLNMRNGLLCRHSVFQDIRGRKYDLQSARFVSRDSKHVGVMQIVFTPLSDKADISVETGISTSVHNAGTATEGRKKHFRTKELGQFKNEGYLLVETFAKKYTVIFRSGFYYETAGKKVMASDNIFELSLRKNQTIVFTKLFYLDYIDDLMELEKLKKDSEKEFRKSLKSSFNNLLRKNTLAWERLWALAEISIWGDPEVEKNLRFNIYHLMICATANEGFSSIGARTLSGEGYRGHVFWDTEIFLLPFYIYTFPEIARSMLLYRYQRLDMARENARKAGFRGAMFPWESASSGIDETPDRAKDLNGKVIKIHTGQLEHHITADVAYAFYYYFNATRDNKFLQDYGYEVLFETARFWASRVKYDRRKKKYVINQVIGPDEFHVDVDNNAFTNIMAKWNLLISRNISQDLKKNNPGLYKKISQKLGLTVKETNEWRKIASKISIKVDKKQVIEQFDGYFRKKNAKVYNWDENY
ncbi:MAG: glycoside hydrolase family 65 protein, partial [Candidatus Omnitrophica bacterium]|nr:glycoside hydrolase family 65 protein [Candidatus Omnitrophota bacterium]